MVSEVWEERRIARLENDFVNLSLKIDGVTNALGVGLAGINASIAALQVSMPDHYMPRREYEVTKTLLEARIKSLEATQGKALMLLLGTLLTTVVNVGVLAVKALTGHA